MDLYFTEKNGQKLKKFLYIYVTVKMEMLMLESLLNFLITNLIKLYKLTKVTLVCI